MYHLLERLLPPNWPCVDNSLVHLSIRPAASDGGEHGNTRDSMIMGRLSSDMVFWSEAMLCGIQWIRHSINPLMVVLAEALHTRKAKPQPE